MRPSKSVVIAAVLAGVLAIPALAQQAGVQKGVVEIPGFGPVDLDELSPEWNVYFQYVCSDTTKQFPTDARADQTPTGFAATLPSIAAQPSFDFAVAWADDRKGGNLHDVYARFFYGLTGSQKGNNFRVNALSSTSNATSPAAVADRNNIVFIAWEEDGRIRLSKYASDGVCLIGPGQGKNGVACPSAPPFYLDDGTTNTTRTGAAITVDNFANVLIVWSEDYNYGPEKVVATRCTNDLSSCVLLHAPCNRLCRGGTNSNLGCTSDADCPSGTCSRKRCTGFNDNQACLTDTECNGGTCTVKKCTGGVRITQACLADTDCPGGVCDPVPPQVPCPPSVPLGAQRAGIIPAIATDAPPTPNPTPAVGDVVVTWQANVNDPRNADPTQTWNGFARGFNQTLGMLKNDFRIDLAPRTAAARSPRVARGLVANTYAFGWRDNRAGHYDIYTRVLTATQ